MAPSRLAILVLAASPAVAYTVEPPTEAPVDTITDCTWWIVADGTETCQDIADTNFLTLDQVYAYNPSLKDGCEVNAGMSYCIEQNWGIPPEEPTATPTSTSTEATPTPTETGNGVETPSPTQDGMIDSCNEFYYVDGSLNCSEILEEFGISMETFFEWNPAVESDCSGLWLKVYACVGVIGEDETPSSSMTTTTTTAGTGITTPTPTQSGMVNNCDEFYYVDGSLQCSEILGEFGISMAQFYEWNPAVKDDCSGLWLRVYACVGVTGDDEITSTIPTSTTSIDATGITTPTPTQSGMVSDCDEFYFVDGSLTCAEILDEFGISMAQFYEWNPAVKDDCTGLWQGVYACVGTASDSGEETPTVTEEPTTTTSGGNGIVTPTPTQTGMVGNCDEFYYVDGSLTCAEILTEFEITMAELYAWNSAVNEDCTGMWLGVNVCVGVMD